MDRLALAVEPEGLKARAAGVGTVSRQSGAGAPARDIFIVHGRAAGGFREAAERFIGQVGLTPVILADQPNQGRTLIEKFEQKALDVGYAVVLLTPEDIAYEPGGEPPAMPNRGRQNVILELGYFMASLGRDRVAALVQECVDVPTDIGGIAYIPLDEGGIWETLLARELVAAGYELDLSKLPG